MQQLSVMVVHGSFSERYRQEFQQLMAQVTSRLAHPVLGAYLECTEQPLTTQITQFIHGLGESQAMEVQILPLFLLPGVHVREDIPEAIAQLEDQCPAVNFILLDYLGKDCRLSHLLAPQFTRHPNTQRVVIAHGSRRTGANPEIETLAQTLKAKTAYWAAEPSLAQTIQANTDPLCIVPYFLFSGRIPKAIAAQVAEMAQNEPQRSIYLGQPFGTEPECATVIAEILNARS